MALLGRAAMLLWYDIVPEHVDQHDEWHTREHFPERLGIPGFLRAQRWVSRGQGPRYFVVYEVADVDILSSGPYLERLNNPTPWTARTMPSFRGMTRGFCTLDADFGSVLGTSAVVVRYSAAPGGETRLDDWLKGTLIPDVLRLPGISSASMFRSERAPEMTAEQRIRGRDAGVGRALMVTGYSAEAVAGAAAEQLRSTDFEANGASPDPVTGLFGLACVSERAT